MQDIIQAELKKENDELIKKSEAWIKKNVTWISMFLRLAQVVSSKSKDPRKVGALIVTDSNRVVSMGYNGFPQGVRDSLYDLFHKEINYTRVIHAEVNALLFAEGRTKGCTLYNYALLPCARCTTQIIQSGIKRIVFPEQTVVNPRWYESYKQSMRMFKEAGVDVVPIRDLDKLLQDKRNSYKNEFVPCIEMGRALLSIKKLTPKKVADFIDSQKKGEAKTLFKYLYDCNHVDEEPKHFASFVHAIEELVMECERGMGLRETRVVEWTDPKLSPLPVPDIDASLPGRDGTHMNIDGKC